MPSPIAHFAAGAIAATVLTRTVNDAYQKRCMWAWALFFSIAPDLDAIPGFLSGNMAAFHNQISHSFFFGVTICLIAAIGFRMLFRRCLEWWSSPRMGSAAFICYSLHLIIDSMSLGPGVKLFWPFTEERFSSPIILFYGVRHSESLFSLHHLITIGNELVIIACFLLLAKFLSRSNHPVSTRISVDP